MPTSSLTKHIVVIGSGVSGLSAAWNLAQDLAQNSQAAQGSGSLSGVVITLVEADNRLGGHANTVIADLDGIKAPVDTGFLVCNERTYPLFIPFLNQIGVPLVPTDMSFAVSVGPHQFEWCGSDLKSIFAQPRNAFSPRFWSMLRGILRFNKHATALADGSKQAREPELATPLGQWLTANHYSDAFRDDYLIPMAAAIWSCPTKSMLAFPLGSFVRFFHNHGLLQISNRPRWFTIPGGSKQYVDHVAQSLTSSGHQVLTSTKVVAVRRAKSHAGAITIDIKTANGLDQQLHADDVVFACHSSQTLKILTDANAAEKEVLEAIPYQANKAYLHTDQALMPARRSAWAAWNYLSERRGSDQEQSVAVTYWLNKLQPLPFTTPLLLTLNPLQPPKPNCVLQTMEYEHPVFDERSTAAQQQLRSLQGLQNTWFAGAWTGYGFHEDGFASGKAVANGIAHRYATPMAMAA